MFWLSDRHTDWVQRLSDRAWHLPNFKCAHACRLPVRQFCFKIFFRPVKGQMQLAFLKLIPCESRGGKLSEEITAAGDGWTENGVPCQDSRRFGRTTGNHNQ